MHSRILPRRARCVSRRREASRLDSRRLKWNQIETILKPDCMDRSSGGADRDRVTRDPCNNQRRSFIPSDERRALTNQAGPQVNSISILLGSCLLRLRWKPAHQVSIQSSRWYSRHRDCTSDSLKLLRCRALTRPSLPGKLDGGKDNSRPWKG